MKKTTNIDILIGKSVSGNASPEEIEQIEAWIKKSSENRKIYKKSIEVWEKSQYRISKSTISKDKINVQLKIQKQWSAQVKRIKRQSLIYKISAILAIPLTFAFSWYLFNDVKNIDYPEQFCEISAPKGHVSKCTLPDGTDVWINTGSTLTYNTTSFNDKSREVKLIGEAYFEVAPNKEKLFTVNTAAANINVTGTAFNIKAYTENDAIETVLEKGSIELLLHNQSHQTVQLIPGERAILDLNKNEISIEKVDTEMYSSWRNGEIIFKDATLNDLIKELERIYDIKFHLKDLALGEFRFRGMFSYNNNLIDALEKIKRTAEIDYYIENKEVWLNKM